MPHVLSKKFRFFFLFPGLYFLPPLKKPSLISYYCNPSLIKSTDKKGGVLCGRPPYQCYRPISLHQLLAAVVFSLITSCQYANKLPRLFSILWLQCKIYDRNDFFKTKYISLLLADVMAVQFYYYFLVAVDYGLVLNFLTCMPPDFRHT